MKVVYIACAYICHSPDGKSVPEEVVPSEEAVPKKLCPKKLCCVSTASEGAEDRITYICACDIDHSVSFWL